MIKVKNIYPDYASGSMRDEKLQEAYTDIQKMFYNRKKKELKEKKNV